MDIYGYCGCITNGEMESCKINQKKKLSQMTASVSEY